MLPCRRCPAAGATPRRAIARPRLSHAAHGKRPMQQPPHAAASSAEAANDAVDAAPLAAAAAPRKRGRPPSKAARKPSQQQGESGETKADSQWAAAFQASVPALVEQLLGPEAAAVAPPAPNTPANMHALVSALLAMSNQIQANEPGCSMLALPASSPSNDSIQLDLVLAPGAPPTPISTPQSSKAQSPPPAAASPSESPSPRGPIKVTAMSSVPVVAALLTSLLSKAGTEADTSTGPTAACLEASGPAAVHNMINVVCAARTKLQLQHGLDCAFAVTSTPGGRGMQLQLVLRRLEAPRVNVADFAELHLQLQQQQQQQEQRGRGSEAGTSSGSSSSSSGGGGSGSGSGSQVLAEVLEELLQQRPLVRLVVRHAGELAFALKALALAGKPAQTGISSDSSSSNNSPTGTYVFFLPDAKPTAQAKRAPGRSQQGRGQASLAAQALQQQALFPLVLEVASLPATPLCVATMGAAQGRITRGSSEDGLHGALASKLSSSGYWSCQLESPALAASLMQLTQRAQQALRYRGTRLAMALELVSRSAQAVATTQEKSQEQAHDQVQSQGSATPQQPQPQQQQQQQQQQGKGEQGQQLVVHFLEYEPVADMLLRPQPRRYELALTSGHQVDAVNKLVALRNRHMATPGTGQLVVRPFVDGQHTVCLAVETCSIAPFDPAPAFASATPSAPTSFTSPSSSPESSSSPDPKAGTAAAPGAALKTFLVSKSSEPSMVARAVGWEILNQGEAAVAAGKPAVVLRMGPGGAVVQAAAAVALAQSRLMDGGMKVVALPRQVLVQEGERRFTVVEWGLVPMAFGARGGASSSEGAVGAAAAAAAGGHASAVGAAVVGAGAGALGAGAGGQASAVGAADAAGSEGAAAAAAVAALL